MFATFFIHLRCSHDDSQQRGHVVIPFVPGYHDIAGKVLKLDHIEDRDLHPLDDLLRDHFLQGVLKNMKGSGEPNWDHEEALEGGGGSVEAGHLGWYYRSGALGVRASS